MTPPNSTLAIRLIPTSVVSRILPGTAKHIMNRTRAFRGPIRPHMSARVRKRIQVRGTVQGVGFRPFVFHLAKRLQISGFVRNTEAGVEIETEGSAVEAFLARLRIEAPVLARIAEIEVSDLETRNETASKSGKAADR